MQVCLLYISCIAPFLALLNGSSTLVYNSPLGLCHVFFIHRYSERHGSLERALAAAAPPPHCVYPASGSSECSIVGLEAQQLGKRSSHYLGKKVGGSIISPSYSAYYSPQPFSFCIPQDTSFPKIVALPETNHGGHTPKQVQGGRL